MWSPCPTHLDTPILVCGLEPEDLGVVLVVMLLAGAVFTNLLPVVGLTIGAGLGLWVAKRGRPAGALIHALHRVEVLQMPGVLRPRPQAYSPWSPDGGR